MNPAEKHCRIADVVLCLGTSLQITPACNLPLKAIRNGGNIVIVNLQPTPKDKKANLVIHGLVDKEDLAPRAARNNKSYAEKIPPEKAASRKKKAVESREKAQRRSSRTADALASLPVIEGAAAQVREWSFGSLSKRDASQFVRAVKRFGNASQIGLIVEEVGSVIQSAPSDAQIELFDLLIDGCREAVGQNPDVKIFLAFM